MADDVIDVPVINKRTGEPVQLVDLRMCEREGCENSLVGYHPSARFCGPQCRSAAWKARTGYGRPQPRRKGRTNGKPRDTASVTIGLAAKQRIAGHAREQGMTLRQLVERATDDYISRHFE